MATEQGIVLETGTDTAWVKTTKTSACKACASKDSCHTQGKEMRVEALNTVGAKKGDSIVLSFKTSSLLKAAFLLYVFPIICMLAGAFIGSNLAPRFDMNDSVLAAITGFGFFFVSFLFIKIRGRKMGGQNEYKPQITKIIRPLS